MFPIISYLITIFINFETICSIEDSVWNYRLSLDPNHKYSLKWNVDTEDETITFLCEVQTRGWIGFGLSPNGGMKGSDMIIGWVDDSTGLAHFNDRYATGQSVPQIDESQDWHLLESAQNSSHTILKFYRHLTSCDKQFDKDITKDTIRIIYAFGDRDPEPESDIRMHGRHQRGARSVLLLTEPNSHENKPQETDLRSFILNNKNVTIPKRETTYWCTLFQIPKGQINVVKFRPYITNGNEAFAHHMSIDVCIHPDEQVLEQYVTKEGFDCTDIANMPKDFHHCFNPYFPWATGGGDFLLPDDVSFPFGDDHSPTFVSLNMHYNNPELVEGVVDSSGLEFYYTSNPRKNEASIFVAGSAIDNRLFVPPNQPNFQISGHCHTDCFQNDLDPDGVKVFAIMPHAHLLGRKIKARHFRDNEELPWIEFEQNYDFNFQSFRTLNPMIKIKRGDQITIECTYDSTDRNVPTFGGLGSYDEMCIAFIYYYPRMPDMKQCFSGLSDESIRTLAGIQHRTELTTGSGLIEYLTNNQDWNRSALNKSVEVMLNAKQRGECYWIKTDNDIDLDEPIGYPKLNHLYEPKEKQCFPNENSDTISSHFIKVVIIASIAIIIAAIIVFVLRDYQKRYSINTSNENHLI